VPAAACITAIMHTRHTAGHGLLAAPCCGCLRVSILDRRGSPLARADKASVGSLAPKPAVGCLLPLMPSHRTSPTCCYDAAAVCRLFFGPVRKSELQALR